MKPTLPPHDIVRHRWLLGFALLAGLASTPSAAGQDTLSQTTKPTDAATQPASGPSPSEIRDLDSAADLLEMKVPVVVSASRRAEPITHLPYAISVITQEDLRRSGARSIPDALRLVPGVDVADLTGANSAVSARGFHGFMANQTLVLVDGRQIFDTIFGGTVWSSWPFQLEDIERIEVIRGPAGVAWGANAMNGVINIITKDPADQQGLTLRGGGGSRGTQQEYLGYGLTEGKLRLRISGEYDGNDGFLRGGSLLRPLADGVKSGRSTLYGIYDAGPQDTVTFSAGSALNDGGFPPSPLVGWLSARHPDAQSDYALGRWTHRVEQDNTVQITSYFNDFHACPGLPAFDYRYQQYALQLSHTFKPNDAHTITWGLDTREDAADSSGADPRLLRKTRVATGTFGLYAQDEWRLAPRWALNLGGRVDYDTYGGFQPSGRAALSYRLTDQTALYGAVSRAFHMAPGAAHFASAPLLDGLAGVTIDPGLKPESLLAYELGTRGHYFDKLDLSANLFWHEFSNISTFHPRLGPPGLVHMNLENSNHPGMYGVELDAKYALTKALTLLGNYTYQQLDWRASGGVWQKDYMTPPRHKFMVGTRYDLLPDLHLSSHLYFVDAVQGSNPEFPFVARDIGQYFRLDLQAEYEFWNKRAALSVGVRGLLDDHHPEGTTLFLNSAEVPRMIYAELRIRFP